MDETKLTNEERAKLGKGYSTIPGSFNSATGLPTTINSGNLTPTIGTNLPPPPPPTDTSKIDKAVNETLSQADVEKQAFKANQAKETDKIGSLMQQLGMEGAMTKVAQQETGAYDRLAEYDQYTGQIEREQKALRDRIKNFEQTFTGTTAGAQDAINKMNRESASYQADLAISQSVAGRNYDRAMAIAKDKVEIELAPKKAELEAKKWAYDNNEWLRTADYKSMLDKEQKQLDQEQKTLDTIESIKLEYAKNGGKNIGAFANAKTVDDAITAAGGFLVSPMEKLQMEKIRAEINQTKASTSKINADIASLIDAKNTIGGTTGNPVVDIITASSKFGDKQLVSGQLEKVQQAVNALGSLETLQGLLAQGKDGVSLTGPVTGRVKNLITKIGGEKDVAGINAVIQGLIPTVARGIFGEVGVLTDADIDNYKKTLPNLTSTEDQNKLVSIIMYDVLSRSLGSTLTTNAQNQTNVSGFAPTYIDAQNKIDSLKAELGYVEQTPETPQTKAYLDKSLGSGGIIGQINSSITNYSGQFTRKTQ